MKDGIRQDWDANRGNWKSLIVLTLYRLSQEIMRESGPLHILGLPVVAFYVVFVEWLMGIELNLKSRIGPGLRLYHGVGLVLHQETIMGKNCALRHCVTIGRKYEGGCPVIGNNVDIGANAVLLGDITIGDGAIIGAGAVVVKDVAPGDVVAGNPARSIRKKA